VTHTFPQLSVSVTSVMCCLDVIWRWCCRFIARRVIAISSATIRGVPRFEWDLCVTLSAAKRLLGNMNMDISVWGHASARVPSATPDKPEMLLAPFGETFGESRASTLLRVPLHPSLLSLKQRESANVTAIVLHGAVYAARDDVACVLHTHSPYASAMAASDSEFDPTILQVQLVQNEERILHAECRCVY
jgi:ribulose-5-phosphate 4-epimerase/fuculose-1-phosphate aldolase